MITLPAARGEAARRRPGSAAIAVILAILPGWLAGCGSMPTASTASTASTGSTASAVRSAPATPALRFGLTADYPPFAWRDADGRLQGADVLAARRVAAALGRRAEFVPTTWASVLEDLAAARFDVLIGGITVTPERAAVGTFSVTLMRDGKRPLVRCADGMALRSVAAIDRPQVRLMVNRGPTMDSWARQTFPHASLTVNRDDAALVPFLLENRADVWITDGVVVDHMARRHAGKLCAPAAEPLRPIEKAWLVRRDPALLDGIDRRLREELRSGAWRRDLESAP